MGSGFLCAQDHDANSPSCELKVNKVRAGCHVFTSGLIYRLMDGKELYDVVSPGWSH